MDYGEVLSRAWQIISKHKILWLFGVLAGCGSGQQSNTFNFDFSSAEFTEIEEFSDFSRLVPAETLGLMFSILCISFVFVILFFVLGAIGRLGLIKGTLQVEGGTEALSLGRLFEDIRPYIARAIGLNLLVLVAGFILVILLVILLIPLTIFTFGLIWLCLIPLFCLFIPISIFIGIIVEQANIALVVEDLGVVDALKRGWEFSRDNYVSLIVMGLILIVGGSIISVILATPFVMFVVPIIIGTVLDTGSSGQTGWILAGICFFVYLPVLVLVNGILQSYIKSAWTLTFMRLSGPSMDKAPEPIPAAT